MTELPREMVGSIEFVGTYEIEYPKKDEIVLFLAATMLAIIK
jgi:hypothetical protein